MFVEPRKHAACRHAKRICRSPYVARFRRERNAPHIPQSCAERRDRDFRDFSPRPSQTGPKSPILPYCGRNDLAERASDECEQNDEQAYDEAEIKARLERELPHWRYEDGWIQADLPNAQLERHAHADQYRGPSCRSRLASSRFDGLLRLGRGAAAKPIPPRASRTRISNWPKRSRRSCIGSRARREVRSKAPPPTISVSPISNTTNR